MRTVENVGLVSLLVIIGWISLFLMASSIDKEHCLVNGAEYGMTTLLFAGYCDVAGVIIPAAEVGK